MAHLEPIIEPAVEVIVFRTNPNDCIFAFKSFDIIKLYFLPKLGVYIFSGSLILKLFHFF